MRTRIFLFVAGLALSLSSLGCMLPETASHLQIGTATATLPKNDKFELVQYEETKADGTQIKFTIKGASANPESALVAYTQAQANTTVLLQGLIQKIPNVAIPAPPLPIPLIGR